MTDDGVLVLLRHGESTHNAAKVFTGRLDVGLTDRGRDQARRAADLLRTAGLAPDRVITSPMRRALDTAVVVHEALGLTTELEESWRLVERDYGFLTDVPKHEARATLGPQEYIALRRTLHGLPGPVDADDARDWDWWAQAGVPAPDGDGGLVPAGAGESLQHVVERVEPCWREVAQMCAAGKTALLVAHGNSLRAMCALIDDLTEKEIVELNLPPGQPLVYRVARDGSVRPRGGHYLDAGSAHVMVERIAQEGGT